MKESDYETSGYLNENEPDIIFPLCAQSKKLPVISALVEAGVRQFMLDVSQSQLGECVEISQYIRQAGVYAKAPINIIYRLPPFHEIGQNTLSSSLLQYAKFGDLLSDFAPRYFAICGIHNAREVLQVRESLSRFRPSIYTMTIIERPISDSDWVSIFNVSEAMLIDFDSRYTDHKAAYHHYKSTWIKHHWKKPVVLASTPDESSILQCINAEADHILIHYRSTNPDYPIHVVKTTRQLIKHAIHKNNQRRSAL